MRFVKLLHLLIGKIYSIWSNKNKSFVRTYTTVDSRYFIVSPRLQRHPEQSDNCLVVNEMHSNLFQLQRALKFVSYFISFR